MHIRRLHTSNFAWKVYDLNDKLKFVVSFTYPFFYLFFSQKIVHMTLIIWIAIVLFLLLGTISVYYYVRRSMNQDLQKERRKSLHIKESKFGMVVPLQKLR